MFVCTICHRPLPRVEQKHFPVRCCGHKHEWPRGWLGGNTSTHKAAAPQSHDDCVNRGDEVRTQTCAGCAGNVRIKVFACKVHGECTLAKKIGRTQTCDRCSNYRQPIRFVTNADLARDTIKLASVLPKDICAVAGIPRSGMIPASLLATHLHLPLFSLHHGGFIPVGCGWRLSDSNHLERSGPVLVLDDTSMYGGAMKQAKVNWQKFGPPDKEPLFATVYCSPQRLHAHGPVPDIWAVDLDDPHFLEWCLFNCGYVRRMAFDLDGIMTVDGTARPQYIPRKFELPLIVTGRLERERAYTESWLANHGVRWGKLTMFPGTMEERERPGALAEYKARHFADSGLHFFCESDPAQAEAIAKIVARPVICPAMAKVY